MKKIIISISILTLTYAFNTTPTIKTYKKIFSFISKNKTPKNIAFDYLKNGYWLGLINLIEKNKIDLNLKNENNKTILDIAKEEKNTGLINLINNKSENKNSLYKKQENKSEI